MSPSLPGAGRFGLVFWFGSPLIAGAFGQSPQVRAREWLAAIGQVAIARVFPDSFYAEHTAGRHMETPS